MARPFAGVLAQAKQQRAKDGPGRRCKRSYPKGLLAHLLRRWGLTPLAPTPTIFETEVGQGGQEP